ncbi:MAG: serine/threonine-protein kinase [Planctomycetota bacterium]
MTSESQAARWKRMRAIAEEALELPSDEARRFVEAACGSDQELTRDVLDLLSCQPPTEDFLEAPRLGMLDEILEQRAAQTEIGARVGPYRLVELIAVGGMGSVYRARRDDAQFEHEVAIKLIGSELAPPSVLEHFRRESQILAGLEHPNITHLLDGGQTESGRPFIVMELVDGVPITQFARESNLSLEEKLDLFEQVCAAVRHAHRHSIVHRDLKPANILVRPDGSVKLLDFGVSKLLGESALESAPTVAGHLTVPYSSPEQLRGEPVTTASDVFSLGVVLYELLIERHPFTFDDNLSETIRRITEIDPEVPSKRRAGISRELDAILLMAMAKEPTGRYDGAAELATDLRRLREGEPITAHPPSAGYRLRKLVSRHRALAAALGLLFLLALSFGIVATILSLDLEHQRTAAVAAGQRAIAAASVTRDINQFLAETLERADPLYLGGHRLEILALLEDAERRLVSVTESAVEGPLRLTLGKTYLRLELLAQAEEHLIRAIQLFRSMPETQDELADALVASSEIALWRWDLERAVAQLDEALSLLGDSGSIVQRLEILGELFGLLVTAGRGDELPARVRELEELRTRLGSTGELEVACAFEQIAQALNRESEGALPESLMAEAQHIRERSGAKEAVAPGSIARATLLLDQNRLEESLPVFQDAEQRLASSFGPEHPVLLDAMIGRSFALSMLDRMEEAEQLLERASRIARDSLPVWHRKVAHIEGRLGDLLLIQGHHAEAEPHLLRAYESQVALAGDGNLIALQLKERIAFLYEDWGRPEDAERWR